MAIRRLWLGLIALGAASCEGSGGGGGDAADADDSGSWSTPASVPEQLECREPYETPAPGGDGLDACVTATLACGETVRGTVEGGSSVLSNESGQAFEWCSGHSTGSELAGPERVYRVDVGEENTYASVRLASCEPLQLLWYQTSQACPAEHVTCSYVTVDGAVDQREDILLSGSGILWFVVEGIEGTSGNFELTVDCGGL
jgi:hypothetical protein